MKRALWISASLAALGILAVFLWGPLLRTERPSFKYSSGNWLTITEIERSRQHSMVRIKYQKEGGSVPDTTRVIRGIATLTKERGFNYFHTSGTGEEDVTRVTLYVEKTEYDPSGKKSEEVLCDANQMLEIFKDDKALWTP